LIILIILGGEYKLWQTINISVYFLSIFFEVRTLITKSERFKIQWYLGIRPLWNKSNLVYVLFGRETFCLVYDLCLEYDSRARTCMSQN
jgi:hypothetical protein